MTQLSLDFDAHARHTDPPESHAAARTVNVARSHAIVLEAFRLYGRMDDRRLVEVCNGAISESRARGARCELMRMGRLRKVGVTGQPARGVWEICE